MTLSFWDLIEDTPQIIAHLHTLRDARDMNRGSNIFQPSSKNEEADDVRENSQISKEVADHNLENGKSTSKSTIIHEIEKLNQMDTQPLLNELFNYHQTTLLHGKHSAHLYEAMIYLVVELVGKYRGVEFARANHIKLEQKVTRHWNEAAFNVLVECFSKLVELSSFVEVANSHVLSSSRLSLYVQANLLNIVEYTKNLISNLSQTKILGVKKAFISLQLLAYITMHTESEKLKKKIHDSWNQFDSSIVKLAQFAFELGSLSENRIRATFTSSFVEVLRIAPDEDSRKHILNVISSQAKENWEASRFLVISILQYLDTIPLDDIVLLNFIRLTLPFVSFIQVIFKSKIADERKNSIKLLENLRKLLESLVHHEDLFKNLSHCVLSVAISLLDPGAVVGDAKRDTLLGISRFAHHVETGDLRTKLFTSLFQIIQSATETETTRAQAACTLASWWTAIDSALTDLSLNFMKQVFTSFDQFPAQVKRELLYGLSSIAEHNESFVTSNMKFFFDMVSASEAKIAERPVSVHALRILLRASLASKKVAGQLPGNQIFKKVIGGTNAYLLDEQTFSRYHKVTQIQGVDDFDSLADCLLLVVQHYSNHLKLKDCKQLFVTISALMSSTYSWKASNRITSVYKEKISPLQNISTAIFEGFLDYLRSLDSQSLTQDLRYKLSETFLILAPELTYDSNATLIAKILQMAHHPYFILNPNDYGIYGKQEEFWRTYKKLLKRNPSIRKIVHQHCDDILSYLVSNQGIGSQVSNEGKAASYAISSLLSKKDVEKVLSFIGESLQKNFILHSSFKKEDFEIYHTSPDQVHRDLEDEIESNPIFYNIPDHKRNSYSLSKQEWEKVLKDEQEIKKKNPNMSLNDIKLSLLKKIYLVKESKLRSQIQDLCMNSIALLDVALSFSSNPNNSILLQQSVSLVSLVISDFISSPIDSLSRKAYEAFNSCAHSSFAEREGLASLISTATNKFLHQDRDNSILNDVNNYAAFAEHVIAETRKAGMLTSEQFSFLIPFLKVVLTNLGLERGLVLNKVSLSQAMSILATHSGLPGIRSRIVRSRIIEIVVDVIQYHSTLSKAAKSTLLSGAPHMLPADIFPLLEGIINLNDTVRLSVLEALSHFAPLIPNSSAFEDRRDSFNPPNPIMLPRIFLALHDENEQCRSIANTCWESYWSNIGVKPDDTIYIDIQAQIFPLLRNSEEFVREITARAIGSCLKNLENKTNKAAIIREMIQIYENDLSIEEIHGRLGVAAAIGNCGKGSEINHLETIFEFLTSKGFKDPEVSVCNLFSKSGENLIRDTSEENKNQLSNIFERYLKKLQNVRVKSQKEQEQMDFITGNLAVYLGTVARYADYNQSQVKEIVQRLIQTLSIHSGVVQNAVSNALTHLVVKMNSDDVDQIVVSLFEKCGKGNYGDRRGAAFGISGLMNGLGISGMRECNIMARVNSLFKQGTPEALEGVMQIYELLAMKLETMFDAYVPEILPNILSCISDVNRDVCDAADQCASEVMKHITPHSARMILPSILEIMKLDVGQKVAYRKRQAAVTLLGAMAYSAPRMLSSYLPIIVNILKDALVEVHEGVSSAAKKALERVGGQAENPEIKHQIPDLLKALGEPTEKSNAVLDTLLFTRFTHSIDPCSLALLMPVLQRALSHRDQNLKKKAGQIIGSVSSLVNDPAVVMPYLSTILPLLHELLIDHQPRVRKSAAKSIGTLTKTLGENRLQDMIDWIHATLQNPNSGLVERHGCSQAVSEICASQGVSRVKAVIPQLVEYSRSPHANVRMGYIQVFGYLPEILQQDFCAVLPECMPRVLQGISDDDDDVSSVSFHASQLMIRMFADSAIAMVLPALEQGMQEKEWRTRHASVVLLGDFLQRISDTNKPSTIHLRGDQTVHIDTIYNKIEEKHVHILLSLLYILHSDSTSTVRSESHRVWRSIVSHSPRTLRSIMPTLIDVIIEHLSHMDEEKRQTGGRCIGELVGRMGNTVAGELIPLLSERLQSPSAQIRQGVCIGLTELMMAAPNKALVPFVGRLLPAIQRAVSDSDVTVQEAASHAFHALMNVTGGDAVVQVVNAMLKDLQDSDENKQQIAMIGLQKLVKTSGDLILRALIPSIVKEDIAISDMNAETLASILKVSGHHVIPHINIFDKLVIQCGEISVPLIITEISEHPIAKALQSFTQTCSEHPKALEVIMEKVRIMLQSNNVHIRLGTCFALQLLCTDVNPKSAFAASRDSYLLPLIPYVVKLFVDPDAQCVNAAWHAFNIILELVPKADQSDYITTITSSIIDISQDERGNRIKDLVPAFNLPKGLDPFIKLFLDGVMSGKTSEIREHAADGLSACIRLTSETNFEPYVLKLGPLIRIASNKFPWQVKSAVLKCIILLLERGGKKAKPFIPSMQTTFVKSLTSSNSVIRKLSADALGTLVVHGARIKSLVTELMSALKALEIEVLSYDVQNHGICISLCNALEKIMEAKGREIKDKQIQEMIEHFLVIIDKCSDVRIRKNCANAFGACIRQSDLTHQSVEYPNASAEAFAIGGMAKHCADKIQIDQAIDVLNNIVETEKIEDRRTLAIECAVEILLHANIEDWNPFLDIIIDELESGSLSNKIAALRSVKRLAKHTPKPENLYPLAGTIALLSKERNSILKEYLEWTTLYIFNLYGGNTKYVLSFFAQNKSLSGDQVEILREYTKKVATKRGNETELSSDDEEDES